MNNAPNNIHIVVDLETFDVKERAIVFSIGLIDQYGNGLYVELNTQVQEGRTTRMETLDWWKKNPESAGKSAFYRALDDMQKRVSNEVFVLDSAHNEKTLRAVADWIDQRQRLAEQQGKVFNFWGNSPAFDQVILRSLMEDYSVAAPWTHQDERDVRTIRKLHGGAIATTHHAMEDARMEWEYLLGTIPQLL